ncbi:hypothetical protein M2G58_21185 [Vibrio vulnificus]|nr:hypothetical protein [Vibrio vulnificus]
MSFVMKVACGKLV